MADVTIIAGYIVIECLLLDHGICTTSSTACFPPCSELATNTVRLQIQLRKMFLSFHQLKRYVEKRLFTSRVVYD